MDIYIISTLYVLVALLIISSYFENRKKYFILLIVFGFVIDVVYTNTFILNVCLFIVCYFISKLFHSFFPYNWFTLSFSNIICVCSYHIITFLFLSVLRYDIYGIFSLFKILSHSILMTVIYTIIVYTIIVFVRKKFQIKEVK